MKQRVLTVVVALPIVLACIFSVSPWPLALLLSLAGFLALKELWEILEFRQSWQNVLITAVCVLVPMLVAVAATKRDALELPFFAIPWLLGISALTWFHGQRLLLAKAFLSIGYIVGPMVALLAAHTMVRGNELYFNPQNPVLLALLPVWVGDTAAIFVGRKIGRTPLAPTISPKKTLEGATANLLAAIAAGGLTSLMLGEKLSLGLICGVLCGTLGQVGDLFESWLKRNVGAKDSGTLLPGHGGILDRIDSTLMTAVPCYVFLLLVR